jgi:hypothetical protein
MYENSSDWSCFQPQNASFGGELCYLLQISYLGGVFGWLQEAG